MGPGMRTKSHNASPLLDFLPAPILWGKRVWTPLRALRKSGVQNVRRASCTAFGIPCAGWDTMISKLLARDRASTTFMDVFSFCLCSPTSDSPSIPGFLSIGGKRERAVSYSFLWNGQGFFSRSTFFRQQRRLCQTGAGQAPTPSGCREAPKITACPP